MQKKHIEASVELNTIPISRITCKWKKKEDGTYSAHRVQGICLVCYTHRTTTYCSICEERDGELFFGNPRSERNYFEEHNELKHTKNRNQYVMLFNFLYYVV